MTLVKKNFNIGLALVEDETKESYAWVLSKLKVVLGSRLPDAFVTDKERSLGAALAEIFSSSHHLLCIWHMKRNIEARVTKLTSDRHIAETFVKGPCGRVLNAATSRGFHAKWNDLVKSGIQQELIDYLTLEWLSCKLKWARYPTNQVFHLGNTSTNILEAAYSSFKTWLHTLVHKLDGVFRAYHRLMEGQVLEVRNLLEHSKQKNIYDLGSSLRYVEHGS